MATVHTEYGPGQIVERETVRGRTRYKVAGEGFEVWLDQTRLGGLDDYDEYNDSADDRDGYEEDIHDLRHKLHADDDFSDDDDPARYSHRVAWAPLDRDNSTELPYNPDPQHHAIGTSGDDGSSTIQPIHNIDSDERLTPSNSISFDEGDDDGEPGPNPDLFAREGALNKEAIAEQLLLQKHGPRIQQILHKTFGKEKGEVLYQGVRGHATGNTAGAVDGQISELVNWASPGGPMGGYGQMIHNAGFEREGFAQLAPLLLRALGPAIAQGVMGQMGGDDAGGESDFGPGEGYGEMIQASKSLSELFPPSTWDEHDRSKNMYAPDGSTWDEYDEKHSREREGSYRPAGLSDRYIDLTASVDYYNDPVAQFRHDPEAYINRIGHLAAEGLDPRFAEYMDLVEGDKNIRTAAWKDVRKKAMRLKREGHVTVKDISSNRIMASVVGDHGTYDVAIYKSGAFGGLNNGYGGNSISNWHCACEWGKWAFRRKYTYVGRLCSHAYASYLTMQSAHMTGKPRQQRNPNQTKYKKPTRNMVFPTRNMRHADNLQNGPERLTPELVVNDTDDAHTFVDVEKDERHDVGPDDVVSEKDIVHFARVMASCEANEQPYPRQLVAFLSRYADCTDGGDDSRSDWEAEDGSGAGEYINRLRDLADSDQSDDFGNMADRVHAIQHTVEEAREHGVDASQFVAMLRTAAPGDPLDPSNYQVIPDGGRANVRGPNNKGIGRDEKANPNRIYDVEYTNDPSLGDQRQGPEEQRYIVPGSGYDIKRGGDGTVLYQGDDGYGVVTRPGQESRGVKITDNNKGEAGGNGLPFFNYDGAQDENNTLLETLRAQQRGKPAQQGAGVDSTKPTFDPNGYPVPADAPRPGENGFAALTPGGKSDTSGAPTVGGAGTGGQGGKGGGGYVAPNGGQTSGTVSDGGKAGAENGDNSAITKNMLDADGNYTVKGGETWTDIAQRTTGDMNNYQKMYDKNKGTAGPNVDSLAVGTKVNLKDFANDSGNGGFKGDETNPANSTKAVAGPAAAPTAPVQAPGATQQKTVSDVVGSPKAPEGSQPPKPATTSAQASLRRAQAPSSGSNNGQSQNQSAPLAAEAGGSSPAAAPATNPATGQPSSAGGAAANPTPAPGTTEQAKPTREDDTLNPADPEQLAEQNQARPGQQPASSTPPGVGMGGGMGGLGDASGLLSQGIGAATDIASGIGGAMPGIGGAISGIASGIGNALSMFSSKQDFDDFVRYAYPTIDGEGDLEPHTHPFAGSGWPGPLDIGTSEEYADEARGGMDDVTDLEGHDVESSMAKWQKQGSYDEATDDGSDIVRAFQANMGGASFDTPSGGGRFDDISGAAAGFLRTAGRNYSLAEQSELIREGDKGGARNLASLDLTGTHYEDMNSLGW